MNRRTFIGTTAVAGAGLASMGLKCGGPSVRNTVTIIAGAIAELKPLFPNLDLLDKIITLANSFNNAWTAGKFNDARTFFLNLDTLVGQVIADLGVNATPRMKLILATLGIGVRTIAALIAEQANAQPAAAVAAKSRMPKAASRVEQLADPSAADALLKASRP